MTLFGNKTEPATRQLTNRAEVMKGVIQRSRDADEELFAFRLVAELEKLDMDAYREQEIANARQDLIASRRSSPRVGA